jgi:type I restriction enzyme S subunit
MTLVLSPSEIITKLEKIGELGLLGKAPNWSRHLLGELINVQNGAPFSSDKFNRESIGMPLIRIRDVGASETSTYFDGEYDPAYVVRAGDLLVGMDGDFRCARWTSRDALLNQRVCRLKVTSTDLDERFLFLVLQGYLEAIWKETSATTVKHLSSKSIQEIPIPLPSVEEQHKIVELLEDHLSGLDAALLDVKQAKIKAAQFRNVYIDDFLKRAKGIKTTLGSVSKFNSGFAYKSSVWQDSGVPVIKIMNVKHREVNLEGCSFVSEEIAESSKNFAVKKGDLLFNMTGATLGAFGFYNLELEARMNQRVGKFVPLDRNELNLNYLAYFLEAASTQQRIQQLAKGAAQPNISPTDILSLEICLPKFEMQNAIVEELDAGLSKVTQVDQLCNITRVESNALRRSLLQAAFTGQLTNEVVSV